MGERHGSGQWNETCGPREGCGRARRARLGGGIRAAGGGGSDLRSADGRPGRGLDSREQVLGGARDARTFTEVIRNNGPEAAELDTVPQITGGVLVGEVCDLGISADTPFCEYGDVSPGTSLTTKFIVRVTATHGSVTVKGGVLSEAPFQDDNPFNQYRTASVHVAG